MLKKEARKHFMQLRTDMTPQQQQKWDDLILIQFQTVELPFLERVMSFYSIFEKKEVNTFILTDYLHFRNPSLTIAYPRMNVADNSMEAIACTADAAFTDNEFGITEPIGDDIIDPETLDLVLVPLLAFDEKGHRIGYGKGYYDRFLARCSPECIKVGVSYFGPVPAIGDAAEFDIPLDLCITPQQVYVF
jgi:5-formyltetrahydrofolate cyclo-ligase